MRNILFEVNFPQSQLAKSLEAVENPLPKIHIIIPDTFYQTSSNMYMETS